MLSFQILASGSKGNAYIVWTENTCLLIEAGLSYRAIKEKMKHSSIEPSSIEAILISHEHKDHSKGLFSFYRRHKKDVYLTKGTIEALGVKIEEIANKRLFMRGKPFTIGDIKITPFSVPHDASDPVGFLISSGSANLVICTDLGTPTNLVKTYLRTSQAIIIEANHDPKLLQNGPYPPPLKQRIQSRTGHLSNDQAIELCEEIYHDELAFVCFAHLSQINNSESIIQNRIKELKTDRKWQSVNFLIAHQEIPTPIIRL